MSTENGRLPICDWCHEPAQYVIAGPNQICADCVARCADIMIEEGHLVWNGKELQEADLRAEVERLTLRVAELVEALAKRS